MRLGILILILIATVFGSTYWYAFFDTQCRAPIAYRIGSVDPKFNTTKEELIRIAAKAEGVWEGQLGEELFIYDEQADFPINLVFDERQAQADKEAELREDLQAKEGMSESVSKQYENLIAEFRKLKKEYESRVVSYESKLAAYNNTVTEWNAKGGAPPEVIAELETKEATLKKEQKDLNTRAEKLNKLTTQLNSIGARGNSLITDYNEIVEEYNKEFSESHEFTQGDYTHRDINIYQFNSEDELTIVLAHEFGHALSLDHVENEESIMYHHMKAQRLGKGISPEDRAEYTRVCADKNLLRDMLKMIPF
jgi:DNA repair exonuclease SbcCD ATPase subunit